MMTRKKREKMRNGNLNPSHQLNLNTKNIHFTKRRLNKIAIDALISESDARVWKEEAKYLFKFY